MRLIDADELKKFPIRLDHYDTEHGNKHFVYGIEAVMEYVEELPTIDPVKHGRWVSVQKDDDSVLIWKDRCSVCGVRGHIAYDYCPNCGARMDGDENEID